MKLLIAGCGYVGAALGRALAKESDSHKVWGMRRDEGVLEMLPKFGIQPYPADLLDKKSLRSLPTVDTVILSQSPSRNSDGYRQTYVTGTANLLEALQEQKMNVRKVVFISSTGVYSTHDGSWVDENTDPQLTAYTNAEAAEHAQWLLKAEDLVRSSKFSCNILRLAGIYGPNRNRISSIREGQWVPDFSEKFVNRIHIEDIVSALRLLIEKAPSGEVYLGVDDEPCTQKEFYTWIYDRMRLPLPKQTGGVDDSRYASNKRCSNMKMKGLGWILRYPSYREGYGSFL